MRLKGLLTLLPVFLASYSVMAQKKMPVLAYMGVPNDRTSEENFRVFHECGFDVSLYGYASLEQLIEACRIAEKYGVQILGHCPETHNNPEEAARQLIHEKGFFGYVLEDEPSAPRILEMQQEIKRLKSVDVTHCFYINLLPYYAKWILDITKTKTYEDYVKTASGTSCQQISFDYYPVTDKGLRWGWFNNLEIIRAENLRSGKPFWGFILSVPHTLYPQPTLASLRLQAYVNLAYGAQAIQYFTYWTPYTTIEYDFHNGPVTVNGGKIATYDLVRQMNTELRPVADLFYGAAVTDIRHTGIIPKGTTALKVLPSGFSKLKVSGRCGAVVSQFEKGEDKYVAIVNKDHLSAMSVNVMTAQSVMRLRKDLSPETTVDRYVVEAGDILIFKIR